ncbi:protein NYNRIN-like isoform X1 [Callithrix jacchus]
MIWKERGFLTTKGTPVLNGKLISQLIQAIQLPSKVAIIHYRGHQSIQTPVARGNAFADSVAKATAKEKAPPTTLCFLSKTYSPQYSPTELTNLQSTPNIQFKDDWAFKHNLLILPEKQRYQIIRDIHNSLHIGPKALYQFLSPLFHPHHLLSTIQEVQSSCTVCARTNSQGSCHPRRQLHQLCRFLPGQDWQIDFTHMPKHKQYRYLLTIVDTFSGWIEAYPTASESAGTVATHLIQDIIPRFGLPATIQSDNGPAFTSKVTNAVSTSLGIQWKLHTAYHPQSSGKVEQANDLIKEHLTKLMLELRQSWVTLLPIALARLRASPRGPSQLSPFELLYGRPFLLSTPPSPYVRTAHQVHSAISLQEQSLNTQLQPHSSPFSWLTFLKEGIKLANISGLTDLTSCLMCASLGQTPFITVPYPIPLNPSASTSPFSPIKEVNLYTPPDFTQLPICHSLGRNYPNCNKTILVTTNLTAPQGTFFWCNKNPLHRPILNPLMSPSNLSPLTYCILLSRIPNAAGTTPLHPTGRISTSSHGPLPRKRSTCGWIGGGEH